jgi:hypothetical protein
MKLRDLQPTHTQVPNYMLDHVMAVLSGAEVKILLYIIRRTNGFHCTDCKISIPQFMTGKKGANESGTGLSRSQVKRSLLELCDLGLVTKKAHGNGHVFSINMDADLDEIIAARTGGSKTDPSPKEGPKRTQEGSKMNPQGGPKRTPLIKGKKEKQRERKDSEPAAPQPPKPFAPRTKTGNLKDYRILMLDWFCWTHYESTNERIVGDHGKWMKALERYFGHLKGAPEADVLKVFEQFKEKTELARSGVCDAIEGDITISAVLGFWNSLVPQKKKNKEPRRMDVYVR